MGMRRSRNSPKQGGCNFLHDRRRNGSNAFCTPDSPIEAFNLIAEDRTLRFHPPRKLHFKGVALNPRRNRTYQRKPDSLVVGLGRNHQSRAMACLFTPGLGIKLEPHDIAPLRSPCRCHYQTSRPIGSPVSTSPCRFLAVTFSSNSLSR